MVIAIKIFATTAVGLGAGFVSGNTNGFSAGQVFAGGGAALLALAVLRMASEVGSIRQMVKSHDGRITRLENKSDRY